MFTGDPQDIFAIRACASFWRKELRVREAELPTLGPN